MRSWLKAATLFVATASATGAGCAGSATFANLAKDSAAKRDSAKTDEPGPTDVPVTGAGDGAPPATSSDATAGSADVPAWVNGSYLTCAWSEIVSAAEAALACHVTLADGSALAAAPGLGVRWTLVSSDPSVAPEVVADGAPAVQVVLTAAEILASTLRADIVGQGVLAAVVAPLVKALPGFDGDGALATCLAANRPIADCLDDPTPPAAPAPPPAPAPAPGPGPQQPATHPHAWVDGVDYYLGSLDESCSEVCATYGGVHPATISVIGSGGDAATCAGVLLALSQATPLGSSGGGTGLGCYADGAGGAGHVIVPATTQAAKAGSARRVCACMQ